MPPVRRRRRLLNVATAISLLLCAATIALWARSSWRTDRLSCAGGHAFHTLVSRHGRFGYQLLRIPSGAPLARELEFSSAPADSMFFSGMVGDIESVHDLEQEPAVDVLGVELSPAMGICFVPHWLVALTLSILPLSRVMNIARRRRRAAMSHVCAGCGYDIRATPQRCPECGAVVGESARVRGA
jgi:predicted RNA-binding Zn-ribbon protein involved in translation (DUF1610 family)